MIHPKIKSLSLFTRSKLCGTQNVKLSWDCQLQNQNKGILKVLHTFVSCIPVPYSKTYKAMI